MNISVKTIRFSLLFFSIFIGLMGTISLLVLLFWGIPKEDLRSQLPAILLFAGVVYGVCAVPLIIRHFLRNKVSSKIESFIQEKRPMKQIFRTVLMLFAILTMLSGTFSLFIIVLNFFTQEDLPDQPFMALVASSILNYSFATIFLVVRTKFFKKHTN
ncbi:hypothetical protein [Rossellomorea vietnamensis]|uniref:hypothetical protein n=1 Tax=Rossellomorea vietnamensis TaxID=218284 RepID=UPI00077CD7F1|nr:hypothetical protein [Rossellomorea vietnamensis]